MNLIYMSGCQMASHFWAYFCTSHCCHVLVLWVLADCWGLLSIIVGSLPYNIKCLESAIVIWSTKPVAIEVVRTPVFNYLDGWVNTFGNIGYINKLKLSQGQATCSMILETLVYFCFCFIVWERSFRKSSRNLNHLGFSKLKKKAF